MGKASDLTRIMSLKLSIGMEPFGPWFEEQPMALGQLVVWPCGDKRQRSDSRQVPPYDSGYPQEGSRKD
jgi:hypothetical protein